VKFDHGINRNDIEAFQMKLLSDALEDAHIWSCMEPGELKDEIGDDVLNKLVACYTLSTWSERAFPEPEPDFEPFED
jgi:hypothetical protein